MVVLTIVMLDRLDDAMATMPLTIPSVYIASIAVRPLGGHGTFDRKTVASIFDRSVDNLINSTWHPIGTPEMKFCTDAQTCCQWIYNIWSSRHVQNARISHIAFVQTIPRCCIHHVSGVEFVGLVPESIPD